MVASGKPASVFIVMGVCGSGKTSIAQELQKLLGCDYIEGDALHPQTNIDKMAAGIPLVDDDRWSWLEKIRDTINDKVDKQGGTLVVTCSSLRKVYRDILTQVDKATVTFVYLKGSPELLAERMGGRKNHFMAATMLQSQLATLEEPDPTTENVIVADIRPEPKQVAANIMAQIGSLE
ncbi:carbohydrate kinase [Chlamydoabsidia padenii]|nr:carbohydrate kinase [Chlamydoabsidia padenii]